jgi:hypothetical protein
LDYRRYEALAAIDSGELLPTVPLATVKGSSVQAFGPILCVELASGFEIAIVLHVANWDKRNL